MIASIEGFISVPTDAVLPPGILSYEVMPATASALPSIRTIFVRDGERETMRCAGRSAGGCSCGGPVKERSESAQTAALRTAAGKSMSRPQRTRIYITSQ